MPRHSRVFRNFLVSYIVILLIPSIAGYMSYRTSIDVTESISIENSVNQLQKGKELLERRMAEVEGFTRQLAINQDLNVLMNEHRTEDKENVFGIWKMMRELTTLGQTNDFFKSVLYLPAQLRRRADAGFGVFPPGALLRELPVRRSAP